MGFNQQWWGSTGKILDYHDPWQSVSDSHHCTLIGLYSDYHDSRWFSSLHSQDHYQWEWMELGLELE